MKSAYAVAFGLFITPFVAFAQTSGEPFTLSLTPEYPRPYGVVTVTPESGQLDLAGAVMTVFSNGKVIYSGNAQGVGVPLSGTGIATTIRVDANVNGTHYVKTATVHPQEVSLVIEPNATAPALYKGKALVPQAGSVRLVAVADLRSSATSRVDPANLSYTWVMDDTTLAPSSGIGHTSITIPTPLQFRGRTVSVTVQSRDGTLVGGDSVTLSTQSPTVRVYQRDSLLGTLYDHALTGSYRIAGSEATLIAVPYSFSRVPSFSWLLSGSSIEQSPTVTLRPQGDGQGSASLSLTASTNTSESATSNLSIIFGKESSNFFGL